MVTRMPRKINRQSVAKLARGAWLTDTSLPGFMARRPNKLVLYGLKMRINGRQRFLSIGSEAEFISRADSMI